MSSPSKRRDMDVMKLMMSDFAVSLGDAGSPSDFFVKFLGPKNSPYEGGIWKVHVTLPANYPYSSPSIGFTNHIYHPNVDFASGSVCLDVINQTWSPMYNLVNVFSTFLPQLLLYPNPADPLNGEAAALMNKDKDAFTKRVQELVKKYASSDIKVKTDDDDDDEGEKEKDAAKDDEVEEVLSDVDDEPTKDMDL